MGRAHEVRKAAMAKTAAKKTKLYSYYGKEIYLAAKAGGPEPDGNLSLRRLIEKAKKDQVPGDVIKRAIDKVKNGAVEDYESVQFEGFGPSGSTVIVKCLTDNINRTISQVRPAFTKSKAKLGAEGSVSYLYDVESIVQFKGMDEETAIDALIEGEVDPKDIVTLEDGSLKITGEQLITTQSRQLLKISFLMLNLMLTKSKLNHRKQLNLKVKIWFYLKD